MKFLAPVAIVALGIVTLIGSGGGGESDLALGGGATGMLYVSAGGTNSLLVYNNASAISGSEAPSRTVSGALTTLTAPRGIAVDMARNRLYVANSGANAILVFNDARSVSGNTAPARTISGAATTLNAPSAIFLDVFSDRLYVANTGGDSILVFNGASAANGNIAPGRTLQGVATTLNAPTGVLVDASRDKLYAINSGTNSVLVFNGASTATGNIAPSASIAGSNTVLNGPGGGALDPTNDRLYVANTAGSSILVFDAISSASGNTAPTRVLSGGLTALNQPHELYLDLATDRLYVANSGANSVLVFNSASSIFGATAPARSLVLAGGAVPHGVFVDMTPVVQGSTASLDGAVESGGTVIATGGSPRTGDVEDFVTAEMYRQFYSFDLAAIPASARIGGAVLRLYQAQVVGTPLGASGLGDVLVEHVNYGASLDGSDYSTAALTAPAVLSNSTATGYRSLDTTLTVQADVYAARARSQYRLRFSLLDTNLNGVTDHVQFTDTEDSCCAVNRPPQLLVTFSP